MYQKNSDFDRNFIPQSLFKNQSRLFPNKTYSKKTYPLLLAKPVTAEFKNGI